MKTKYDMRGNFQGATLNIESKIDLQEISVPIAKISSDSTSQIVLQDLFSELVRILEQAYPAMAQEAETVAESAKKLVEEAAQDQPNKSMIRITADGLRKAAENISGIVPPILTVVEKIITTVMRLVDL